jgi:hypothetical protein
LSSRQMRQYYYGHEDHFHTPSHSVSSRLPHTETLYPRYLTFLGAVRPTGPVTPVQAHFLPLHPLQNRVAAFLQIATTIYNLSIFNSRELFSPSSITTSSRVTYAESGRRHHATSKVCPPQINRPSSTVLQPPSGPNILDDCLIKHDH